MSGYKDGILITYLLLAIGDEVSGIYNERISPVLMLFQDVRHSHFSRQDKYLIVKRYLEGREADAGCSRLMSDYEVTLVNDNSRYCLVQAVRF